MTKRIILFSGLIFLFSFLGAQDSTFVDQDSRFKVQGGDSVKIIVKKKWVAALLAFPLFGITGAHRVYLGTEPYIPLVYLATLGGFGILPLVDFIVILCTPKEKLDQYYDNGGVFMWGK